MKEVEATKLSSRRGSGLKHLFGGCPREYVQVMKLIDAALFFAEPNYKRIYELYRQAQRHCGCHVSLRAHTRMWFD